MSATVAIAIAEIAHVLSRRLEFRDGSDKCKPKVRIQLRLQRLNASQKPLDRALAVPRVF